MSEFKDQLVLACAICNRKFPADTPECPDDEGCLLPLAVVDPLIGKVFADKYEITSLLGEGGMSRVYKARHTFMKRSVAVKVLHESATDNEVAKARFQREAEAASSLSHPNVVTVHDFGLSRDGQAYFTMDCLEGESLADLLRQQEYLHLQQAIEVFTQACEGLDHAHRKGVIHRDIKPSNIVIIRQDDGSNLVKIVDFGIAKIIKPGTDAAKKQLQITQTGEIFGTACYMSPEQCNGRELDARSDIYSFGCLMYESFTGQAPLIGDSYVATVVKHVNEAPEPLSKRARLNVPESIENVIMKCLEKDPANRFATAAELKQALYDAAYVAGLKGLRMGAVPEPKMLGTSGSVSAQKVMKTSQRTRRMYNRNLAIVIGTFVTIMTAGGWYVFKYPGTADDPGTWYDKFAWQLDMGRADDLMSQGKYGEAVSVLEKCERESKRFGTDNNLRLESTLSKLVTAYSANHDPLKLETVNNELIALSNGKVLDEYNHLMDMLKQWEQVDGSNVRREQLPLQATAFGERIARCADKLSVRSQSKQEALLKRAIKVFDMLNRREGVYRTRFRIQLAEIYRQQERLDEQRAMLQEAVIHSASSPETEMGWRSKIKADLMLGMLDCHDEQLTKAQSELENALSWTRAHLANDKEMLRDCLNATSEVYRRFRQPEMVTKAQALVKEAKSISSKLDDDPND